MGSVYSQHAQKFPLGGCKVKGLLPGKAVILNGLCKAITTCLDGQC
jgi:hypothetical protein